METGIILIFVAATLTSVLAFIGSILGMGFAGQAASGVVAEKPNLFGKALLMQALPGSQGIYGLVGAFLILNFSGVLGNDGSLVISTSTGVEYLLAGLPIAITGLLSGIYQGLLAASGITLIAKDEANTGRAVTLAAMVETWAIFGVLISFILLISING
jgi:V/A-type H+-transporting ATPase subunit K